MSSDYAVYALLGVTNRAKWWVGVLDRGVCGAGVDSNALHRLLGRSRSSVLISRLFRLFLVVFMPCTAPQSERKKIGWASRSSSN